MSHNFFLKTTRQLKFSNLKLERFDIAMEKGGDDEQCVGCHQSDTRDVRGQYQEMVSNTWLLNIKPLKIPAIQTDCIHHN